MPVKKITFIAGVFLLFFQTMIRAWNISQVINNSKSVVSFQIPINKGSSSFEIEGQTTQVINLPCPSVSEEKLTGLISQSEYDSYYIKISIEDKIFLIIERIKPSAIHTIHSTHTTHSESHTTRTTCLEEVGSSDYIKQFFCTGHKLNGLDEGEGGIDKDSNDYYIEIREIGENFLIEIKKD